MTQAMLGTVKDLASVVTYCTAEWEMFILRGQSQERLQWHQGITVEERRAGDNMKLIREAYTLVTVSR